MSTRRLSCPLPPGAQGQLCATPPTTHLSISALGTPAIAPKCQNPDSPSPPPGPVLRAMQAGLQELSPQGHSHSETISIPESRPSLTAPEPQHVHAKPPACLQLQAGGCMARWRPEQSKL